MLWEGKKQMMHSLSVNDNIVRNSSAANASISKAYNYFFAEVSRINTLLIISVNVKLTRSGSAENLTLKSHELSISINAYMQKHKKRGGGGISQHAVSDGE